MLIVSQFNFNKCILIEIQSSFTDSNIYHTRLLVILNLCDPSACTSNTEILKLGPIISLSV